MTSNGFKNIPMNKCDSIYNIYTVCYKKKGTRWKSREKKREMSKRT